jgi:hypothetical protein
MRSRTGGLTLAFLSHSSPAGGLLPSAVRWQLVLTEPPVLYGLMRCIYLTVLSRFPRWKRLDTPCCCQDCQSTQALPSSGHDTGPRVHTHVVNPQSKKMKRVQHERRQRGSHPQHASPFPNSLTATTLLLLTLNPCIRSITPLNPYCIPILAKVNP